MNDVRKVAQVSTDTKSALGGTRMSEAATPAVAAGNRMSTTRIVGGAGGRGVGHPRQRFNTAVAAAARRGSR
jgi:hypothetical protein